MKDANILVWLPSPMGDAILCIPALRAIRRHFESAKISFLANAVNHQILSPCSFNDTWLEQKHHNPLAIAKMLRSCKFTHSILFKNSFASALAVFLAAIPLRIGYTREGRSVLLTDRLYPPKWRKSSLTGLPNGRFKPISMVDYYLAIASWLGADTTDRSLELTVDPQKQQSLRSKLPELADFKGPIVVLVPGGAFGPSKRWPAERFGKTADWLTSNYGATVVVSVSSDIAEKKIAEEICASTKHRIINLAEKSVTIGELKALFALADLVITNDTGPRHIAIAMGRKVITLFGPNDPAWTETNCENEIKIIGKALCAPCAKPFCRQGKHLCMEAITIETVCSAAAKLLENRKPPPSSSTAKQNFVAVSNSFLIDADFVHPLRKSGLTSIDAVFSFDAGFNLAKNNLAAFRSRLRFELKSPPTTLFLKRYNSPPLLSQLSNWCHHHRRISYGLCEVDSSQKLTAAGINTPKIVCYGWQCGTLFEKRSFCITEKIPNAESLECKLPRCFSNPNTTETRKLRRDFIAQLAALVRNFHATGLRHRDLYFSHIFYSNNGQFYLIDLTRVFKPLILTERFRIKDIAQLYYSAPGQYFSGTDRLRFYLEYTGRPKLTGKDKIFIRRVINKTQRMARHNAKHGRPVPFAAKQAKTQAPAALNLICDEKKNCNHN